MILGAKINAMLSVDGVRPDAPYSDEIKIKTVILQLSKKRGNFLVGF